MIGLRNGEQTCASATGFPGLGNLKAEALQEANQYCVGRGSDLFVTRSTETQPPYVLGNYPRPEIEFRCASPGKTAKAAVAECNAKRLHGELKSYKASVECSNPKIFAAYREAGDPNLDLLNVYLAARLGSCCRPQRRPAPTPAFSTPASIRTLTWIKVSIDQSLHSRFLDEARRIAVNMAKLPQLLLGF
jgi:hypothetical protein